jgi:long-subunit acyl-CoA synthetase (AMP-forming)
MARFPQPYSLDSTMGLVLGSKDTTGICPSPYGSFMQHNHGIATLNHLFFHHLDHYRLDRLLSFQDLTQPGGTTVWSTERFVRSVLALRQFLLSSGLAAGDRVAVFAENRPEWHVADFAILLARLVVVPIYNTQAPAQIGYLLRHSGCRVALIAGARQWEILQPLRAELPELETVVGMEETPGPGTSLPRIVSQAPAFDSAAVERIRAEALAIDPQSLATIVYTSGTTGTPKGVMLSHANLTFNLRGSLGRVLSQTARQALSVLPLAHVLERMLCYGYFHEGVPIAYGDPHDLKELLKLHRPEIMGVVPRILEKVLEAVDAQVEQLAPWRRAIGERLIAAALERARHDLKGEPLSLSAMLLAPLAKLAVGRPAIFHLRRRLAQSGHRAVFPGGRLHPAAGLWPDGDFPGDHAQRIPAGEAGLGRARPRWRGSAYRRGRRDPHARAARDARVL